MVSDRAHLILPHHQSLEAMAEEERGVRKLGTTLRGIGPAYEDKAGARGRGWATCCDPQALPDKLAGRAATTSRSPRRRAPRRAWTGTRWSRSWPPSASGSAAASPTSHWCCNGRWRRVTRSCSRVRRRPCWTWITGPIRSSPARPRRREGRRPAAACLPRASTGSWAWPRRTATRVGTRAVSERDLRRFGRADPRAGQASTGPPRAGRGAAAGSTRWRCATRRASAGSTRSRSPSSTCWTSWSRSRSARGTGSRDERSRSGRRTRRSSRSCEPIYETHAGLEAPTAGAREWGALPENARRYLGRLAELAGTEIGLVSTGPDREQTLIRSQSPLASWFGD